MSHTVTLYHLLHAHDESAALVSRFALGPSSGVSRLSGCYLGVWEEREKRASSRSISRWAAFRAGVYFESPVCDCLQLGQHTHSWGTTGHAAL